MKESEKRETAIERLVTIGLINSTKFTKAIRPNWDNTVIGSKSLYQLASWCIEFFDKYEKAPGKSIEDIYFDKKENGDIHGEALQKSIKEDLEELAGEYDEGFNVQYAVDRTLKYVKQRQLEKHLERIEDLVAAGEIDEAEELALSFQGKNGSLETDLERVMCTSTDFANKKIHPPRILLTPWLTEQSLNLVYGPRGVGKSWLCTIIAILLTRQKAHTIDDFGPSWSVNNQTGVLYIDGEMNNYMLQQNIKDLTKPLPAEDPDTPLFVLSGHDFSNKYDKQLNLDATTRKAIYDLLRNDDRINVLVLDNASALTPGLVENSKEDWDPVNQWMVSLKHLGVSVLLVHHAGQSGKQRGTTGREDAMDTIIKVDYPKNYDPNVDYAWFKVMFQKSRNMKPGASKKSFSIRIVPHEKGGLTWEQDETGTTEDKRRLIMYDIMEGKMKLKDIAEVHKVSAGYVSQIKKHIITGEKYMEYVRKNGKRELVLTQKGEDFLD